MSVNPESLKSDQTPTLPEWTDTIKEKSLLGFLLKEVGVRAVYYPAIAYNGIKRALNNKDKSL